MRFLKVLLPLAVALVLGLGALAVPAAAAAPANTPTWHQGQAVGYGTHYDIGALADTYLSMIRNDPSLYNITSIHSLNVTGSLDSWEVDTVSQVTPSYYALDSQSANGFKLHLDVNVTMDNLPQAGTYQGTMSYGFCSPSVTPTGSGTVAVALDATILATGSGTSQLQVSNLAYVNSVGNGTLQANVVFTGYHLPSTSMNLTTCTETVTYENPTFTLTANTKEQVRMLYQPAWDFFNFPISDNKTWWANSTATVGATLSGTVDLQGLTSQDEQAFFDNLTLAFQNAGLTVTGLSAFPIDLAKITILAGPTYIVNNGVVSDYPLPVNANFRAIASAETLSDGSQHPTYLITDASYECPSCGGLLGLPIGYAAVYAPDFPAAGAGMIVGYQLIMCTGSQTIPVFELKNTSTADAQQNIGQTENTYQVTPTQGNTFADFFLQAPYWGILLIVAVVVVVAALLVMRQRRRSRMAPPGAQPPATPPPPTPPPPSGPGSP